MSKNYLGVPNSILGLLQITVQQNYECSGILENDVPH